VALLSNSVDLRAQVVTEHLEPRYRRQLGGSVLIFWNAARDHHRFRSQDAPLFGCIFAKRPGFFIRDLVNKP